MGLELEVRHKDQTRKVSLKMAELPSDLPPPTLPPARSKSEPGREQKHKVGRIALNVPEFKNEAWAYVPEHYDPAVPHGVVVWLHGSGRAGRRSPLGPVEAALRCRGPGARGAAGRRVQRLAGRRGQAISRSSSAR